MVLKYLYVIAILFVTNFVGDTIKGPLINKYESAIYKQLNKADLDQIKINNLKVGLQNLEAYSLSSNQDSILGYLLIKEVKACSLNGCLAKSEKKEETAGSEYFDISVLTNVQKDIVSIKVLDYFSDYGYQITSKRYLKRFTEFNLCDFATDNSQVDGISGATISFNGLINSLSEFCTLVN